MYWRRKRGGAQGSPEAEKTRRPCEKSIGNAQALARRHNRTPAARGSRIWRVEEKGGLRDTPERSYFWRASSEWEKRGDFGRDEKPQANKKKRSSAYAAEATGGLAGHHHSPSLFT